MSFTPEQRAISLRLDEISRRLDAAMEQASTAQVAAGEDIFAALIAAMNSAREIGALQKEHGSVFREFLNTF